MKNVMRTVIRIAALALALLLSVSPAMAYGSADEVDSLIGGIIDYNKGLCGADTVQQWIDTALAEGAGTASDWYVIGLSQYDPSPDFSAYADALEDRLSQSAPTGGVTGQRHALALAAVGRSGSAGFWSAVEGIDGAQGVMSRIFGLHLLNYLSDKDSAANAAEELLALRLPDGGWAVSGEYPDVDVTAMAVQALAPSYSNDPDIRAAIDDALLLLSQKQLDNGGFASYGSQTPESSAQVIVALTALGIDPAEDERFTKSGGTALDGLLSFRLTDGSFCHTADGGSNQTATTQAFYALVSLWRLRSGLGPLYVLDAEAAQGPGAAAEEGPDAASQELAQDNATRHGLGYKAWAYTAIGAVAILVCLLLWLLKKHHCKNYLFVLAVAALAVCFIAFTDFQSAQDYYGGGSSKTDIAGSVSLTIRCDTVAGSSGASHIPADGVILDTIELAISDGDTVYDLLTDAARQYGIQLDSDGSSYIRGIGYLYELDFGGLSGWVYHVNGVSPSVGCGSYALSDGDRVEWLYSLDLGEDVK